MQINKEKIQSVALGFVDKGDVIDREMVITKTSIELASQFHDEFSKEMLPDDLVELRRIFKWVVRLTIDWPRLYRKANPEDYADGAWRMQEEADQIGRFV
jgi:hypothetical protein